MPGPEQLGVLIPIIAVAGAFLMGIVSTMTRHQRKMAELYHRNAQPAVDARVDALQRDVTELKDLLHQQTIALDNLARAVSAESRLHDRVGA